MNLCILDDDPQYGHLLSLVAEKNGWHPVHFCQPDEFFSRSPGPVKVLVLDLIMPNFDGIEVIRRLAAMDIKPNLILISGFDTRVLHSAQQFATAHHFNVLASMTKPLKIEAFESTLQKVQLDQHDIQATSRVEKTYAAEELSVAIDKQQLVAFLQPQVDVKTGELRSAEVLARWQHPEDGIVYPDSFIPLAESSSLIQPLTNEILRLSIQALKHLSASGINVPLSVNLTASDVKDLSFPERLKNLCEEHQVQPEQLVLELTESAVMGELTSSLDVLNRLRMKGFKLSIDDFGTGYSSFSHLYQAPFSELKIDHSFVIPMLEDNEAMVIVKICVSLGHMLGMKIVAEGVENDDIRHALEELGCDIAQGYEYAKPLPFAEFVNWHNKRSKGRP